MLNIEDLKVGDELECIDIDRFERSYDAIRSNNSFEVLKILSNGTIVTIGGFHISHSSIKYFKKKEQSQYTFDDLIDVAVKANKDQVINGFTVVGAVLNCQTIDGKEYNLGIGCEVAHGIEYLQSLYKETFVIECEEDIKRIKCYSTITLANGNTIKVKELCKYGVEYSRLSIVYRDENYHLTTHTILELKGATVEQSKC